MMCINFKKFVIVLSFGSIFLTANVNAQQQSAGAAAVPQESIALKSGETADLGPLFYVVNCHSLLKGTPVVEVLEGLPDVTVSVKQQKVVPRRYNCANEVPGGILILAAPKEVKAKIQAKLILRIKYPTVDGERQHSREINLTLFP